MKNKRLILDDDIKKIFKYILISGLADKNFETDLAHYKTKFNTKKDEAEIKRAILKFVTSVDKLIDTPNSAPEQKVYEAGFDSLLALAQKYNAPEVYFSLACGEYMLYSPRTHELFDKTIETYKQALSSLTPETNQYKECHLDMCRALATMLTVGYMDNDHRYKMLLKEFLNQTPNTKEGKELLDRIGDMFISCQNAAVATKIYERLYSFEKRDDTMHDLIDCYCKTDQYEKAKKFALKCIEKNPKDIEAIEVLIICASETDEDFSLAQKATEKLDKNSCEYYKLLYKIKLDQDQIAEAFDVLHQGCLRGFEKELAIDYANIYHSNENFSKALPYFEAAIENKGFDNILLADYAFCLFRTEDYQKAWKVYSDIIEKTSLPSFDSYILAMQTCLYSYSDEFVNMSSRGDKDSYLAIQESYYNQLLKVKKRLDATLSLNYSKKAQVLSVLKDVESVFKPQPSPSFMPNRDATQELNFDNLLYVFNNWAKESYVKRIFTKTEIEQLRSDIRSAVENKDNPYYSFAGCLSCLHTYVEKYTEPVYYFYLMERIITLQQKHKRYSTRKNSTLSIIREKTDIKNQLLANRKEVPKELKAEIDSLTKDAIYYSKKVDKIENKLEEMLEMKKKKYNLGHMLYLTAIVSKQKIEALRNQDTDELDEEPNKNIRMINPAFGKFLTMHLVCSQEARDMQLFSLIFQSNLESYRFLRNDAVHANNENDYLDELDEFGDPKRNWDSMGETPVVGKETFFALFNIALFSPTSIFYYLKELDFPETYTQIEKHFKSTSGSSRTSELEK